METSPFDSNRPSNDPQRKTIESWSHAVKGGCDNLTIPVDGSKFLRENHLELGRNQPKDQANQPPIFLHQNFVS